MIVLWLINIMIPGAALMLVGKFGKGALVAAGYLLAVGVAACCVLTGHPWLAVTAAGAAGGMFALSQVQWFAHVRLHRRPRWRLHVAALRETAEAHVSQERFAEAIEVVEAWLGEDPRSVDAWLILGEIHLACGHGDRAERAYRRAQRLDRPKQHAERIAQALDAMRAQR